MIQHQTAHILNWLNVKDEGVKLELIDEHKAKIGDYKPCVYCLASDGKCRLEKNKSSNGKHLLPMANSCVNGRYIKQSVAAVDKRKVVKTRNKYDNICTNRAVLCRIPGCGKFESCVYMDRHYKDCHENDIPPLHHLLYYRKKSGTYRRRMSIFW